MMYKSGIYHHTKALLKSGVTDFDPFEVSLVCVFFFGTLKFLTMLIQKEKEDTFFLFYTTILF